MRNGKIVYYDDELNDEFSSAEIEAIPIDGNYRYLREGFWGKVAHFFWYRIVATPLAFLWLKLKFSHRIEGRKLLKGQRGYFLYGNHTQDIADALIPSMMSYPTHLYTVVHPNNVSMPVLGKITPYLGALPLPDNVAATKNFVRAIETKIREGRAICIYPEAHIWPYFTGIRNFTDKSFRYPVRYNKPSFAFTNTYRKKGKRVQIVTYIDGPFFPDESLPTEERKKKLRDEVYAAMCERAKASDVQVITYLRRKE